MIPLRDMFLGLPSPRLPRRTRLSGTRAGMRASIMEPRISIITLGVSDLKRSIEFYGQGLGFPAKGGNDGIEFFMLGGAWLALYPLAELAEDANVAAGGTGFRGFTLAHNVKTREEVDSVLAQAVAAGATLPKPAADAF